MSSFFLGTLVLNAKRRVKDYDLLDMHTYFCKRGHHVEGRYNGHWSMHTSSPSETIVYLPQRHKHMQLITCCNPALVDSINNKIQNQLQTLDSRYPDTRQLFKLNKLLYAVSGSGEETPFASVVNIEATTANGKSTPGSFYLLSFRIPIYMFLCYDQKHENLRLSWSSKDLIDDIRSTDPLRYVFYRFPVILNRPIFLPSQALCSKWWAFISSFEGSQIGMLKACNAFESLLFKDPNLENF